MNRLSSVILGSVLLALAVFSANGSPVCYGPAQAREVNCMGWQPIFFNDADHVTAATLAQVEQHDDHGAEIGCWKLHGHE